MGLMKAARLAPDAILLPADFDAYRHYSQRFKAAVTTIATEVEDRGIDTRPVVMYSEPKSISRETTFERDLHPRHDRAQLTEVFSGLCARVAGDLRRKGYVGRTIGIKLRYQDFRTVTRDVTLPSPTSDAATIRRAAGECLRRVPLELKLRLLGVRIGALSHADEDDRERYSARQAELPL